MARGGLSGAPIANAPSAQLRGRVTLFAKLYVDILGDPKLLSAARKGARQLVVTPWLIAFAKLADDGGRLTISGERADPRDVAALLPGVSAANVERCQRELLKIGVLVEEADGILRFAKWGRRSGTHRAESVSSDEDTAAARERKRRQRENALWRDIERDGIPVTPRDTIPVTERDGIPVTGPVTEPVTSTRARPRSREIEQEIEPRDKSESVAHAREALIAKLGGTEPARETVSGFLDCLPPGGVEEIKWIQLLAVGFLEGAHMPGRKPARPEHVLTALVEFNMASRHEWPYSGGNVRSFIERVQRGELRAREAANGNGKAPSAADDLQARTKLAGERVSARRNKRDGEVWWAWIQVEGLQHGCGNARDILLYAGDHLDDLPPNGTEATG